MKYLKVFVDFADKIELLGDAERGRLFKAMLEYASSGAEPDLRGNERFIWPTAKSEIDRQAESYKSICETNKRIATERYGSLRTVTERNEACQDKDKDKDKDKEKCFPSYEEKHKGASALDSALNDFAEMRKKMRKPLTDRALALTLAELEKLAPGDDEKKIAILNQSIQRGWQGVFPLKDEHKPTSRFATPDYDAMEDLPC